MKKDTRKTKESSPPKPSTVAFHGKVVLSAGGHVVAESNDPKHWHDVLGLLTGQKSSSSPDDGDRNAHRGDEDSGRGAKADPENEDEFSKEIVALAREIGVTSAELAGACGPTKAEPYMQLDNDCWEKMKKALPARGKQAVSNVAVCGTLLALWGKKIAHDVNLSDVQKMLSDLDAEDKNPKRGLTNCSWLRYKSGVIAVNPASTSEARALAKKFCTKKWGQTEQ